MADLESTTLSAAIICIGGAIILWIVTFISKAKGIVRYGNKFEYIAIVLMSLALLLLTTSVVARAVITGHGPFSNMYEFAIAFAWGMTIIGIIFWWKYRVSTVIGILTVLTFSLLLFASELPSRVIPLIPALQQSFLLTSHVLAAIISYGAFAVSFSAAILYLVKSRSKVSWIPQHDILDIVSYRAVTIGFPFMTLTILLGAIWADIAWGRYWAWDPKETASLVTWLLYAGYLHMRIVRGWKGIRASIILIVGFLAVLFTFFGNYIFSGLHSYL